MAVPTVAIIGRPNVGKSSLLNALAGKRISIVEPTAGVTRDRISTFISDGEDNYFELVDTGGYGIVDSDQLNDHVENQIQKAMASADLILFMVDIRDGITPLDQTIARLLRRQKFNVMGVANKADSASMFHRAGEFVRLGFGEFLCISALNNLNKKVLVERIFEEISHLESEKPDTPIMKVAIVGKRNSGKSTLVNAMAGAERVIVSEVPGTTRDAVDVRIDKDGKTILVIDTAGVRKKNKIQNDIEFYGYVRATRSINRADVVHFLIDSTLAVSQVDKKLARYIMMEYKSCIIVINKWDLAKDNAHTEDYEDYLTKKLPALKTVPLVFTTASEGKNVQSLLDLTAQVFKQTTTWVPTAKLNKVFEIIKEEKTGASRKGGGGWPKIYYATQIAVSPVTILMFVNKPTLFDETYMRYLVGRLQAMLGIDEVPIRLLARAHRKDA